MSDLPGMWEESDLSGGWSDTVDPAFVLIYNNGRCHLNGEWHVYHGNARNCYCGRVRNPAYRSWWQRFTDRRQFKKIQRRKR